MAVWIFTNQKMKQWANYGNAIITNTSSEIKNPTKPFQNTLKTIQPNGQMTNFIHCEQRNPPIPKPRRQHQNRCSLRLYVE